jgi:hypothetical protein
MRAMKLKTIQKISLTTIALVASLAITAWANGPRDLFPTAAQSHVTSAAQKPMYPLIHQPPAGTLWYNGDFDGINGLANERDDSLGSGEYSSVYDDFIVPASDGSWHVTSVFSDNLANTNFTGATWEIRQGISEGNGGTLIASGSTDAPVVTATGRSGFGYIEYQVEVDGLDECLQPGTYFLNVTPTGDLTGRSFDSTTSGANAIGMPPGNDFNSWWDSNFFGVTFTSAANGLGAPADFSMGVIGDVGCGGTLTYTSAFSEKGPWDIDLPFDGSGVEDRSGGKGRSYALYFVFGSDLASVASATTSCGTVASFGVDPDVANQAEVDLTGVTCNENFITVAVGGIVDVNGNTLDSASITFGLLIGDINGDGVVDHTDYHIVRSHRGELDDSSNFRSDVAIAGSGRGVINASDVQLVQRQQGTSLP